MKKQREHNDLYKMSHDVTIRVVLQSFAKVFPGEPHDADAILRCQILLEILAAEVQHAQDVEVVGGDQQLADVFVVHVDGAQVSVLEEQIHHVATYTGQKHVRFLARVQRRCE